MIHESLAWKSFVLNVPEIKPSSIPRAAPIIPNEKVANHSLQLLTSFGSSPIESLKMLVGFLAPAPILIGLSRAGCYNCAMWCRKVPQYMIGWLKTRGGRIFSTVAWKKLSQMAELAMDTRSPRQSPSFWASLIYWQVRPVVLYSQSPASRESFYDHPLENRFCNSD